MEFLIDYAMFFVKVMTIALMLCLPLMAMIFLRKDSVPKDEKRIFVKRVNDRLEELSLTIYKESLSPNAFKKKQKSIKNKKRDDTKPKSYLINFDGDIKASAVTHLRDEITAILRVARKNDTVLLRLESAGGTLHGYGLAASQLERLKNEGLHLTVLVDKIAASGGYLMACVADEIIAAPFAIVGSIGVVAQLPNFNRLLKKNDVDFELLTAGKHKRSLTMFGENTEQGREKFQADIDIAHEVFKEYVSKNRKDIDIEKIATGEYWQATNAITLGLVDRLATSDDVILENAKVSEVFEISSLKKQALLSRLFSI